MAQIPNLVPTTAITDSDLLVTRQSGVDKNFSMLVMKQYLGVPEVGITPYMSTVLDDSTDVIARATLGVTRATTLEATTGVSTTATMSPSTTKDAIFTHAVPAGSPVLWPTATPPAGWIECAGQTFNVSTYPKLALAYPSGTLPDLRGEFIRGWDHGRGVDSGRTIGSTQSDAIRDIQGTLRGSGANSNVGIFDNATTGLFRTSSPTTNVGTEGLNGNTRYRQVDFKASNVVPTAADNRPRNVSFMYIVRLA